MVESLPKGLLDDFVCDLLSRSYTVQDLADRHSKLDYQADEPRQLLLAIASLAAVLREEVLLKLAKFRAVGDPSYVANIRALDERLRRLNADIRLAGRATSDRVPGVLSRLLAEKVGRVYPGSGVILRPAWNYRYKIHRQDIQQFYEQLFTLTFTSADSVEKCLDKISSQPLFVISFPILERDSVHLHSVLGHELGHLLAREYSPSVADDEKFYSEFWLWWNEKGRGRSQSGKSQQPLFVQQPPELVKALAARERAIKEYAADAAGVLLLGLSAVFGAVEYAAAKGLEGRAQGEDTDYPTWGARLQRMLALADDEGWLDFSAIKTGSKSFRLATTQVQEHVDDVRGWLGSGPWPVSNQWTAFGHRSAEILFKDITTSLKRNFGQVFPDAGRALKLLPNLFERLERGIPPDLYRSDAAKGSLPDLEDILLASWWYRLSLGKVTPANYSDPKQGRVKLERLRRLTMKAMESVDVKRRFADRLADLEKESG